MSKQAFKRLRRKLHLKVNREPLPAYAWPGGYPMYYLTADCDTLCHDCVNAEVDLIDAATFRDKWDKQWRLIGVDIMYENPDGCSCAHCNRVLESAYGED